MLITENSALSQMETLLIAITACNLLHSDETLEGKTARIY